MYLLKVEIQLYKDREWISFTARGFQSSKLTIEFHKIDGNYKRIYHTEIRKLKIVCYKSIKQLGG